MKPPYSWSKVPSIPIVARFGHIDRSVETAGLRAVTLRNIGPGRSFTGRKLVPDAASLDQRDVAASGVPRRAGASPIRRSCDRPAMKRICVNGLDFRTIRFGSFGFRSHLPILFTIQQAGRGPVLARW